MSCVAATATLFPDDMSCFLFPGVPCILGALIVAVRLIPILMDWNTGVMLVVSTPRRDAWRDGRTRYRPKADHDHQPQEHDER